MKMRACVRAYLRVYVRVRDRASADFLKNIRNNLSQTIVRAGITTQIF